MTCSKCGKAVRGRPSPTGMCKACRTPAKAAKSVKK